MAMPMSAAYYASQPTLKGKCKPVCYFVIRPGADTVKGGQQKSFAAVKAQIRSNDQIGTARTNFGSA